jgi:quinol monooxygenase YgiN
VPVPDGISLRPIAVEETMFIALYHWKVKEGREKDFRECWHRITEGIYQRSGSLGSRLHQADDGTWVAYAQWPDRQTYDAARSIPVIDAETRAMFRESIEEAYPDIYMNVTDDLLQSQVSAKQKS